MLIKTGNRAEFRNLLAAFRLAALNNRKHMAFSKKKFKYKELLDALRDNGFIGGYEERGEFLVVHFHAVYDPYLVNVRPAFEDVAAVIRKRRSGTLHQKDLNKYRRQKGPLELCFISTDRGILNSNSVGHHLGGVPLFMIK